MTQIFISHSHVDKNKAHLLVDYLLADLELKSKDIRCSSVEGSQLPLGKPIGEQLKRDLKHASCVFALITTHSLNSKWVLFELALSWGTDKLIVPILAPGLTYEDLFEPLRSYPVVDMNCENPSYRMLDVVHQLSSVLSIEQESSTWSHHKLDNFVNHFKEIS